MLQRTTMVDVALAAEASLMSETMVPRVKVCGFDVDIDVD